MKRTILKKSAGGVLSAGFVLLLSSALLFSSCAKEIRAIESLIERIENESIADLEMQIDKIKRSLKDLEKTDEQLDGYIKTLQTTAANLQTALNATNEALNQAKEDLKTEISNEKAAVLAELTSARAAIEGQITQINAAIEALQAKDVALDKRIDTLSTYVNTLNQGTKDWASATFSTLEQYQATTEEITAIKTSITSLNASITELETRLNAKIGTDIAAAVSTLEGELATKVTELTTAYTSAISTAKGEITAAYTTAIANAISNSEASMKEWVNEQLTGYYTITQAEGKLDSLHTVLNGQLTSQQVYIESMIGSLEEQLTARIGEDEKTLDTLRTAKAQFESALAATNEAVAANTKSIDSLRVNLKNAKSELTEAYTTAINTAITTLDGKLTGEIATAVTTINTRIDGEVSALNAKITTLTSRVSACEEAIAAIQTTLQKVQSDIATLNQQIAAINASISELQATDSQLDGYIQTLQTTAANLQTALDATNEALNQAKEDLRTEISNEKAAVLAELTSARTAIEGQITQINTAIEALQAKDVALDKRIDTLSTYVNTLNQGTKDWASATFSTLEQYNRTTEEITAIKASITSLNASMTELETRLNAKIGTDIAAAVSTLEGELATKVTELTTAYTSAISTAKGEITAAYTTAIANAISASETSLKGWVNEQLTGYYTIAQTEAKLTTLQSTLTSQLNSQKTYFDELIAAKESDLNGKITASAAVLDSLNKVSAQSTQAIAENKAAIAALIQGLKDAKTELTTAYTAAIATAISTSEGKLEGEIATQIAAVNTSIDTKIAEVNTEITSLKFRVTSLETAVSTLNARLTDVEARLAELEKLLGQIQSVVVIPDYSDGSVACQAGSSTFCFEVFPSGIAAQLAEAPLSAFTLKAVQTQTKALSFVTLPVSQVTADGDILCVTASTTGLSTDFFYSGNDSYNAVLQILSGSSHYSTSYFPLYRRLPLPDGQTTDLSAQESANCYVVASTGKYKFRGDVKGNGSEPLDGTPAKVELLWESFGTATAPAACELISCVNYRDGYVVFETPSTLKNGNAVIAVKDASNTILWSWHIWVCSGYDPVASAQTYYNNAGTLMDRNLGATSATPGNVGALGLLYLWGRKDPFLSGGSISSTTKAKSTLSWPSPVNSDSSNGTIEYAVKNPTTFIKYNSSNYDWYYTGSSSTDNTRWQSSKTIYDPCPPGWRVPDGGSSGVWSKAVNSSSYFTCDWDSTNRGMNFSGKFGSADTIWYPAAGHLYRSDGYLRNVGNNGLWWSCTPLDYHAYLLGLSHDGGVNPSPSSFRARGLSVRCLKIVPVTGVSLPDETLVLAKGGNKPLVPTFTPATASNQNVSWSSSDPSVATVDQSGKVTAVKEGTATITVTTEEGDFTASCTVQVLNGVNLAQSGTANCYVVPASNTYFFDAVKGNSSESVGDVASAEVLWESFGTDVAPSVGEVVASASYVPVAGSHPGCIRFSMPSTLKNGNAVIAVKDASNTILWSWHIWVCKDFDPVATGQEYSNDAGTMMDRNLGATSATPGDVGALGLLYQWGRKDPFLGSSSISSDTQANSTLSWPSPESSDSSTGKVAYAVANPTTFITGVSDTYYDWVFSSRDNKLWQSVKTIYDPCPPGWRVPDGGSSGVWSNAVGSSSSFSGYPYDSTNKGMNFSNKFGSAGTIWYPAAGYLGGDGGSLTHVGSTGYWWSCTPNDYSAYYLLFLFSLGTVSPSDGYGRAYGQSVRCLQE